MKCNECNNEGIVNAHFKLCQPCNNMRLHGNKYGKQKSPIGKSKNKRRKSLFTKKVKEDKGLTTREKDVILYEAVFNESDHKCEECCDQLNTVFKDQKGFVNWIWTYSHIIQKSIAPELRHQVNNINRLCMKCHTKWESGKKTEMKIYEKNKKRFPNFLD